MGNATGAEKHKRVFKVGGHRMARATRTVANNTAETEKVEDLTTEEEKAVETANNEVVEEDTFIYIGPTLSTGIRENAIFKGPREKVEEYLKNTIDKCPQVRLLLVTTGSLAKNKAKVKTTGTLLNKYYTDVLSLSKKQ